MNLNMFNHTFVPISLYHTLPVSLPTFSPNQHMEEFKDSFIPPKDPRHQVVERVVRHLAERNQDIPEISTVPWSVHVVDSPTINAFVLPVGTHTLVTFQSFTCRMYAEICTSCRPTQPHMIKAGSTLLQMACADLKSLSWGMRTFMNSVSSQVIMK